MHTHACAFTHFSVGLQARKAVATSVSLRSDVSAVRAPVDFSALPSWTPSCGETTSLSDSLLTAPLLLQAAQTHLTAGCFGCVTMAEPVIMVSCKNQIEVWLGRRITWLILRKCVFVYTAPPPPQAQTKTIPDRR